MIADLATFFEQHASAVFALLGVLGASALALIREIVLKHREFELRVWEKVVDRRLSAHETVLEQVSRIRATMSDFAEQSGSELQRAPAVFYDRSTYVDWYTSYARAVGAHYAWLSTALVRELNLFQDYLVNLQAKLERLPDDRFYNVGCIVHCDFVEFAASLEQRALTFIRDDLKKPRLEHVGEWHKYRPDETRRRLLATAQYEREAEIAELCRPG